MAVWQAELADGGVVEVDTFTWRAAVNVDGHTEHLHLVGAPPVPRVGRPVTLFARGASTRALRTAAVTRTHLIAP